MSTDITIISNNVPRFIIYGFELTQKEKNEFDYYTNEELDNLEFFRYKGNIYSLDEFMRIENNPNLKGWDGYCSDSYFSGVLVKIVDDESVVVGRYYS